jgi:transposase
LTKQEETSRRLYTTPHPFSCGIDLHARTMDVCILSQSGESLGHRTMQTAPAPFLHVVAPYRPGRVVAVACLFTWDWLADLCADEGLPCVLGQALSMQAIHGGKATNDKLESPKRAARLRGGLLPQASVSPAHRRATRALLRRRLPLAHTRAECLAHGQHTHSPSTLPAIGTKIAYKANRDGVAARCAAPAVHKSRAVALARLTSYDGLRGAVERTSGNTATHPDAHPLARWPTVPGLGTMLSLVLLYDIQAVHRCPRGQDLVSSCRLVQGARASAGKRDGTSGTTSGQAHLQ